MQFREALAKICKEPVAENGAFLTYAKLSDLCGNDYESVRKISLFYQIDRKLLVAHHIQTEGKLAVPVLLAAYPAVQDLISRENFREMVYAVAEAILGENLKTSRRKKGTRTPNQAIVKKNLSKRQAQQVQPTQQVPSVSQNQSAATANAGNTYRYKRIDGLIWPIFGIMICLYLAGLFFLYRFVASTELATWAKWLIGIGSVVATAIVLLWPIILDDWLTGCIISDSENVQPIFCGITFLVNTICYFVFASQTTFLTACITITLFLLTLLCMISAYSDGEEFLEYYCPVLLFAELVIIAVVFSFPLVLQWILGIAFAVLFTLAIWKVAYDESVSEYGLPAFSALIFLLANAVLLLLFKEQYRIVFHWIAATCAIHSVYHAWHCFDDYESGFGVFSICNIVLALGSLVLPFIF